MCLATDMVRGARQTFEKDKELNDTIEELEIQKQLNNVQKRKLNQTTSDHAESSAQARALPAHHVHQ